jgi:hypothetical protein
VPTGASSILDPPLWIIAAPAVSIPGAVGISCDAEEEVEDSAQLNEDEEEVPSPPVVSKLGFDAGEVLLYFSWKNKNLKILNNFIFI